MVTQKRNPWLCLQVLTAFLILLLPVLAFGQVTSAPSVPTPLTPANGLTNASTAPRLTWTVAERATTYVVQLARNETFTEGVITREQLTGTVCELTGLTAGTRYFWHVRAVNAVGSSAWSVKWSFTTASSVPTLPSVPVQIAPVAGATGLASTVRFSWNAVERALTYTLQVATNETFTTGLFTREQISGTAIEISGFAANTRYFWRVKAVNTAGVSAWSTVRAFTTAAAQVTVPSVPTLLTPSNGATNVATAVRFTWNPAERATTYVFQMARNETFTEGLVTREQLTGTVAEFSGLLTGAQYFWHVRAVNASGSSAWSATWRFTTASSAPTLPSVPVQVAPVAGATGLASTVRFSWNAAERALTYTLQVATNETFTTGLLGREQITGTVAEISGFAANTRYFWRVKAVNAVGVSAWSTVRAFTTAATQVTVPSVPTLLTPSNGATNPTTAVRFTWNPAERATTYVLQLARNDGFTDGLVTREQITGTVAEFTGSGLLANTQYFWRVRAVNASGASAWSVVWRFTTGSATTTNPSVPVLLAPANAAINVTLSPQLSWKAAERATSYVVQIARNETFTEGVANSNPLAVTYIQCSNLAAKTRYFWRVKAFNATGQSAWSPAWSFTTTGDVALPVQ